MFVSRIATILLFTACAQIAVAADKRQHGSHEHGTAKLDVAIEQNTIYIALDTPAANIIGFEHAPRNREQKATLHKGLSQLMAGSALFMPPKAAACRLVKADVDSPFAEQEKHAHADEHKHGHDDHGHDKHGHDEHGHDKHGHDKSHDKSHAKHDHDEHDHDKHAHDDHGHGHDHEEHEAHADIRASWQFDCKRANAIDQLDIRLFEKFPGMQRLQVQTITSTRQGGTILTSSNPVLTF